MLRQSPPDQNTPEGGAPKSGPSTSVFHQGLASLIRTTLALLGVLLIPIGVIVALLTPIIPVGLPIVILGVVLVARNALWGRRAFQAILARHPTLERFAPDWLMRMIFGEHKN